MSLRHPHDRCHRGLRNDSDGYARALAQSKDRYLLLGPIVVGVTLIVGCVEPVNGSDRGLGRLLMFLKREGAA